MPRGASRSRPKADVPPRPIHQLHFLETGHSSIGLHFQILMVDSAECGVVRQMPSLAPLFQKRFPVMSRPSITCPPMVKLCGDIATCFTAA